VRVTVTVKGSGGGGGVSGAHWCGVTISLPSAATAATESRHSAG